MKITTTFFALCIVLLSCNSGSKEESTEATEEISTKEPIKSEPQELKTDPIEFFNSLAPSKYENITTSTVDEIETVIGWDFTVHNFAQFITTICATSTSGETILFVWDYDTKKYTPFVVQPELTKNVSFNQIQLIEFESQGSKSIEIFTNDFFIKLSRQGDERNFPFENSSDVRVSNDSLYITTAKGVLKYLNTNVSTGDREGDGIDFYTYISHIGDNYIVLVKMSYVPDLMFVNLVSGVVAFPPVGMFHNLHISPNLQYAAISASGGGYDANSDPNGRLVVYNLNYDKPELIFKMDLGPIGRVSHLKWLSSSELLLSTNCQNYSVKIKKKDLGPELIRLVREHQFPQASQFIFKHKIDVNDYIEIIRGSNYLYAKTLLSLAVESCDYEIVEFLLSPGIDPNIASIDIVIPEYEGAIIPENFDIYSDQLSEYKTEKHPLEASIECEEAAIFNKLTSKGATNKQSYLKGTIKWSLVSQLKHILATGVPVKFVPNTDNMEILTLLAPNTNGAIFGELDYGEGGDVSESELMIAVQQGKNNLIWFMLESGADPNACYPDMSAPMDKDGLIPCKTALAMAREKLALTENPKYEDIIKLLLKYGAKEIDRSEPG